jgi:hypothetical protein
MALSESALSDLLDAFRAGDGVDLIRESVRLVLQELIEVEGAEAIGAVELTGGQGQPIDVSYKYDGNGNRVLKTVNGATTR